MFVNPRGALLSLFTTITMAIFAVGCLNPSGPSGPSGENKGSVLLAVEDPKGVLNQETMKIAIVVKELESIDEEPGDQPEILASEFEVSAPIILKDLQLGPKEFAISVLLKDDNSELYKGSGRHLVVPGSQKVDSPISLKRVAVDQPKTDLNIVFNFTATDVASEVPEQAAALEALEAYQCTLCHQPNSATNAGIILSQVPFQSTNPELNTHGKILARVIAAVKQEADAVPMPPLPFEKVSQEGVDALQKWSDAVANATSPVDLSLVGATKVSVSIEGEEFLQPQEFDLPVVAGTDPYTFDLSQVAYPDQLKATVKIYRDQDQVFEWLSPLSEEISENTTTIEWTTKVSIEAPTGDVEIDVIIED